MKVRLSPGYRLTNNAVYCIMIIELDQCPEIIYRPKEFHGYENLHYKRGGLKFMVKAVAKCHPDDKYDSEVGKRIAESRASKKAFNLAKSLVRECTLRLDNNLQALCDYHYRLSDMLEREEDHCKNLLDGQK